MTNNTWLSIAQISIYVGAMIAATGTFGSWWFSKKIEEEKEEKERVVGVITPGPVKNKKVQSKYPISLQIGHSGVIFNFQNSQPSKGYNLDYILSTNGTNFTLFLEEDNIIKISVTIRDKTGKMVAELIKNEWKINKNNFWDRNYTKNAIEVKGPDGNIVLQAISKEDKIIIQIKLYDKDGIGRVMMADPSGKGAIIMNDSVLLNSLPIEPIFTYPSDTHLGEIIHK